MDFKDYYRVMGVSRDATQDQIKQSYRKLARKFHPDVSKEADAEERFKELGEAYEVLKDPEKRAAYDQLGSGPPPGESFRPPPDWGTGFEFRGAGDAAHQHRDSDDFFESLFGRNFRGPAQSASRDHHARVVIDLEAALHGGARQFTLQVPEVDGEGRVSTRERTLSVQIPRGIQAGQRIRLAGQGAAGQDSADKRTGAGDLFVEVSFAPHPVYRLDGSDLYLDLPVAPWEAALGAAVRTPTPEGIVELRIPAGSQAGARLRLKGRGLPAKVPGDLYAVLKISLPAAENEAARAAYRALAEALPFNPRVALGV
jgi:curved DNA-binding protein